MKTMCIPKGQALNYDSLETEHLVVNGVLNVAHGLRARTISGDGLILAGTISADDVRVREIEAASVYCLRLAARRVQAAEVFASESAAVSCYLCADYVAADRLTVAQHEVGKIDAREVAVLTPKKRSLFRLLLASALRSLWASLTRPREGEVLDAEYRQVEEDSPVEEPEKPMEAKDVELERITAIFKLLRDSGYTMKIIPGTPEENAPTFGAVFGQANLSAA
nr:hypothetical protein [uncultured Oscillibacter sp.]